MTLLTHPATGYRVTYRRALDLQLRAYIRVLDGRADHYEPFRWEEKRRPLTRTESILR